ncbi:FAD-binding oxidoreductase [candidate division KSB1 bacterium]|nr:FAD-binding oxidoreductase [candidate division KSB1 bacterium]
MTRNEYDVIIIGGGIIGAATGYYLTKREQRVLLLEKQYLGSGSTGRCIGGIRAQFSTETTIKVAMESVELFRGMEDEFGFSVDWFPSGYLFLAYTEEKRQAFLKILGLQQSLGLDVRFVEPVDIRRRFNYININGVLGGTYCPTDGQADPFFVLKGYMLGMVKGGSNVKTHAEVVGIDHHRSDVFEVAIADGDKFYASKVLNAAGPCSKSIGEMVGIDLLAEPERHESLITEGIEFKAIPMIVDYRPDGCYFVQRTTGQIIGCYTPEVQIPGTDTGSTFEFLTEMPRRIIRLIPALESVAILRQWAGSYTITPDGNPIVDKTDIQGYYVSTAMCGHGFMLGPALGKLMANFMIDDSWPYDMSEFAYKRNYQRDTEVLG